MPPKPTPPEDESLGIPNAETVLISSNSETATKLCGVCSRIPAWFWTQELEVGEEVSVELQPFKEMRAEAQNGCCLCQMLCSDNLTFWMNHQSVSRDTLLELGTGKLARCRTVERALWYLIRCRFEAARTDAGYMFPIPSSWCPRSLTTADENSDLLLMQDWIDNCRLNHISCNNVIKDFLPTRLLDLEAFNGGSPDFKDDIKLVRSASYQFHNGGSVPHYITLSHCWGPPEKRPITTTNANIAVRMERICWADLPRTFQDAVVLTRKLGQRYLWIDSLCIIQDDEDDWANEASMMAKVYTQSYCTLAALSSANSTEGLRVSGKACERLIIDLSTDHRRKALLNFRLFSFDPPEWKEVYDGFGWDLDDEERFEKASPLRYRAWALQEKELSTRSIHFGFGQLLWECREFKGTSQLPWHEIGDPSEGIDNYEKREWAETQPEEFMLSYRMTLRWHKLSQEYSSRSLTKETDKLLALSGIARSFQKYFPNDKYMAGIWSSHLPLALLWRPTGDDKKRYATEYIAPSWSWASQLYGIWYYNPDLDGIFLKMADKTSRRADKWLDELEVVNIKGQPKHGDDYGALKEGAYLELRGALLFELDSDLDYTPDAHQPPDTVFFCKGGVRVGKFWSDFPGSIQGKLLCLGIYRRWGSGVAGLILREHIRDGSLVYSRVAYVDGLDPGPSLWNGSERRQITLI